MADNQGQRKLVALGLSLGAIAKVVSASRPTISRWRKGEGTPKINHRRELDAAYEIPIHAWDEALGPGDVIPDNVNAKVGRHAKKVPRTFRKPDAHYRDPRDAAPQVHPAIEVDDGPARRRAPDRIPPYPERDPDATTLGQIRHSLACIQHDLMHRDYTAAGRSKARADETRTLALISKLEAVEELREDRYVREHPAWIRLRDVIIDALESHPEATKDVLDAIGSIVAGPVTR